MTLQEAIYAANAGNEDAMLMLGDHYSNQNSDCFNINEAISWYEMAANRGIIKGIFCAMQLWSRDAYVKQNTMAFSEAYESWDHAAQWALLLITSNGFSDMNPKIQNACWSVDEDSVFGQAVCLFYGTKDCEKALEKLENHVSTIETKCHLLKGVILWDLSGKTKSFDQMKEAYENLLYLEKDNGYLSSSKSISEDALLIVDAVLGLSFTYYLGIPGYLDPDLNRARNTIVNALQYVQDTQARETLSVELQKL